MKSLQQQQRLPCRVCGKTKLRSQMIPAALVRNAIADQIRKAVPDWSAEGYICASDLKRFRMLYIENLLELEKGELSSLNREVLESLKQHEPLTIDIVVEFEKELTVGEKLSDKLYDFEEAVERVIAGLEKKNRLINKQEREIVAYHEMGHAIVALALPGTDPVQKISIIPRGIAALGYTMQVPTEDRFLMKKTELENKTATL